jgi:subtilisin family serine protease
MRRLPVAIAVALSLLVLATFPAAQASPRAKNYIVVLKGSVTSPGAVASQHARAFGASVKYVYRSALEGYAARIPASKLGALRADPRVAFVMLDRPVHATAQSLPTGVDRIQGDVSSTASGDGAGSVDLDVAVIDTGIDLDHPDLNVVGGKSCLGTTKGGGGTPSFDDGHGHGTHVAGTIGARDDGEGVVGVAPGVRLWAVRVLNAAGSGTTAQVICGIDFVDSMSPARGGPIRVANMSLGGFGFDFGSCGLGFDAMHAAICRATNDGVLFVVAAGNDNANFSSFTPAAYDEVLAVTAEADFNGAPGGGAAATCRVDVDETPADFSNFATPGSADAAHTIAGPGVCITSTWMGGGYNTISGTSMASPHVAGTAALCIASGVCTGTPAQIMQKLRADAAAQPLAYGFTGDPAHGPVCGVKGCGAAVRYYGYLAYAGGY